jgi:hypothetical protein
VPARRTSTLKGGLRLHNCTKYQPPLFQPLPLLGNICTIPAMWYQPSGYQPCLFQPPFINCTKYHLSLCPPPLYQPPLCQLPSTRCTGPAYAYQLYRPPLTSCTSFGYQLCVPSLGCFSQRYSGITVLVCVTSYINCRYQLY